MSRLYILLAVLAAALLLGGGSLGQVKKDTQKDPPTKEKGMLPANWGKLGLAEDQKQKIYKIQNDYRVKMDELQKKIDKLDEEMKAERLKVLTAEQKDRLKKILLGEKDK
jgi:Spy/CpxP family protein refolding chaperone